VTPAELFTAAGRALRERWKADVDHVLGIKSGWSDDWSKGRGEPPAGVRREVLALVELRARARNHPQ